MVDSTYCTTKLKLVFQLIAAVLTIVGRMRVTHATVSDGNDILPHVTLVFFPAMSL